MSEYIERDATVELLRNLGNRDYRREKGTIQEAIKMVSYPEYTPAADVAPVVHGRWVTQCSGRYEDYKKCSYCHTVSKVDIARYHYCPNCGAKMDGEEET